MNSDFFSQFLGTKSDFGLKKGEEFGFLDNYGYF